MAFRTFARRPLRRCRLLAALLPLVWLHALPAGKPAPLPAHWVSTWATALSGAANQPDGAGGGLQPGASEVTLREVVRMSLGGPLVRVTLSNEFGAEPLRVEAVRLALAGEGGAIQLASSNRMTFGGADAITIPPGAVAVSDAAALAVAPGAKLAVSIALPAQPLTRLSAHANAFATNYAAAGNVVGQRMLPTPVASPHWLFLKAVDVQVPGEQGTVAAFGDSITEGVGSTADADARWPDVLAQRLAGAKRLGVVNLGIGGNRLLHDGHGQSALARFDRDVLALPGVRVLVLLEGINDIGVGVGHRPAVDAVTLEELEQAQMQLVERAHGHGIRVVGATLLPYEGAGYATPEGETMRVALNEWIRSYGGFDGVVDFDAVIRDPRAPGHFAAKFDSGDHLHPNDAGYRAMGDAVNLKILNAGP